MFILCHLLFLLLIPHLLGFLLPSPMLDSVAGGSADPSAQRTSGLTALVSSRLDSSRSNRARRDHAAGMLSRKPRSKAQRKPSLMDGFSIPKIEDCITSALSPAGQPLDVINLKYFWKDTGERNDATSQCWHQSTDVPLILFSFTNSIAFLFKFGQSKFAQQRTSPFVEEENPLEILSEEEEVVAALTANPLLVTSVSSEISPQLTQIVNTPSEQPALWASTWNLPALRRSTFYAANLTTTFYRESKKAFFLCNPGEISPPPLRLVGPSCESLSQAYLEEVRSSFIAGNFTCLLSPDRHFIIQDGSGDSVTSGRGVETEVIHGAFMIFSQEHDRWFTPAVENFSTLATVASTCSEHVSQDRLNDLGILGALVALNLVNECPALPLNPLFVLYLIYEGDFGCLTEAAVSEWSPDLRYLLRQWIDLPPHELPGILFASHFATYHDLQLQTLAQRDLEIHRLLGYRMLHNAVIGKLGISSLEVQAFQKGFRLPVSNGLTFCELNVNLHLDCSMLFSRSKMAITSRINPQISLKEAEDDPSFRICSFCWAVSGAPFLPPGSRELKVILVSDDNRSYLNGQESSRSEALRLGVHSYKTCF
ncbi:hypothetical protein DFH05DRAFT_1459908 [Lentinula detonsa]|uniref:HECT domain-containing protein n=1 Tax=Lentinula detonsa TaxID=2804962 RepID=A0A9W8P1B6_9AGAR|nr:hypothetical protein DFH05DRAFT_1459908 [Lentinula detonsa]